MSSLDFPHDGPVHVAADDEHERAYYVRGKRKYKRVRQLGCQSWSDVAEQEIDADEFWMIVACLEFRKARRSVMV